MAAKDFTSPFPTSHDTLGASTLQTPLFMPSSPPRITDSYLTSRTYTRKSGLDRAALPKAGRQSKLRPMWKSGSPHPGDGSDSETNLSAYTFDLGKLQGVEFAAGKEDLE